MTSDITAHAAQRAILQRILESRHRAIISIMMGSVHRLGLDTFNGIIHQNNKGYQIIFSCQDKMAKEALVSTHNNDHLSSWDTTYGAYTRHLSLYFKVPSTTFPSLEESAHLAIHACSSRSEALRKQRERPQDTEKEGEATTMDQDSSKTDEGWEAIPAYLLVTADDSDVPIDDPEVGVGVGHLDPCVDETPIFDVSGEDSDSPEYEV